MKNFDKYNEAREDIHAIILAKFMEEKTPPEVVWENNGSAGVILRKVDHISSKSEWFHREKPTNKEVEQIRIVRLETYSLEPSAISGDRIVLNFKDENRRWGCMWSDIGKSIFLTKEEAEKANAEWKLKYEPREGYLSCHYCGEVHRPEDMHQATLIPHPNQPYLRGPWWFCKSKPCSSYAQFSLEG